MSTDRDLIANTLDAIETAETELLTWGLIHAQLSESEFQRMID